MESIAYLANRNFLLVAVDLHYEFQTEENTIVIPNARKVYTLNSGRNGISVIGNPIKITNIIRYLLKLHELGYNKTFEEILEEINDVFNSSSIDLMDTLKSMQKFVDGKKEVSIDSLYKEFGSNPDALTILTDVLKAGQDTSIGLTHVVVFGWDEKANSVRVSHNVSIGNNLFGNEELLMDNNYLYIKFASASIGKGEDISVLEKESIKNFQPFVIGEWDDDKDTVAAVIDIGKTVLSEGLKKISPYAEEPNIVFYEMSFRTNYRFEEPTISLCNVTVT
jgi:hypothetical protein